MKAYILSLANDDEGICDIVFADSSKQAKKKIYQTDLGDWDFEWIDIRVRRSPKFDGMETLTRRELAKETWREGWQWYDEYTPEPTETTDEEFYKWYDEVLGGIG